VVKRISNTSSGSGTAVLSIDAQHVWATTVFQPFKILLTITDYLEYLKNRQGKRQDKSR